MRIYSNLLDAIKLPSTRMTRAILSICVLIPVNALAQRVGYPNPPAGSIGITTPAGFSNTFARAISFFGSFIFAISVIIFLYAGFLYLTAGDDEKTIDKAKSYLTNGVIGLIIALFAWSIPWLVASMFGGAPLQ